MRNNRKNGFQTALWVLMITANSQSLWAATFSGTVSTDDNTAIAGAIITVSNTEVSQKKSVYTDRDGFYLIQTPFEGKLSVRVRTLFFEDVTQELSVSAAERIEQNFVLETKKNELLASETLTASAHVATLEWESENTKTMFISQCNYCHQVGNALTRRPRERGEWTMVVRRMQGYGAMLPYDEAVETIDALHQGFSGAPIRALQSNDFHDGLADAKVEEWLVGDGLSFIHDADVAKNGNLYGADEAHDIIWELDMKTNQITEHKMPDPGLPVGGLFSALPLPLGIFSGKHGPHSMAEDENGKMWITNSLSSYLLSFDTHTKEFESYSIDGNVLYPHTVRIDKEGIVWFTIVVTNQMGRFDPKTKEFTIIDLPVKKIWDSITYALLPILVKLSTWSPVALDTYDAEHRKNGTYPEGPYSWLEERSMVNLPYGIDIHPLDGSVWYAKLNSHQIGRIDPKTLEVKEWDTPLEGPRRHRFDSKGILWIPSFDENSLMRFDPNTETFKSYLLPNLAENEWEIPYALNIHPETDDIWITSNNSDRIFRFYQKTETFVSYPSPTRVTFLRDLVFTKDGKVCSSQSNLPAYAIEGGRPSFICLDPTGALKDRAASK